MLMNEQSIQARIAELNQQRALTLANLQALDGAIADCQWWLARIQADTVKTNEDEGND
jgi:uncharacterized coiled-coil protein SlyX